MSYLVALSFVANGSYTVNKVYEDGSFTACYNGSLCDDSNGLECVYNCDSYAEVLEGLK